MQITCIYSNDYTLLIFKHLTIVYLNNVINIIITNYDS